MIEYKVTVTVYVNAYNEQQALYSIAEETGIDLRDFNYTIEENGKDEN